MELSERKLKILQAIISDYVRTAEPVGSRTLSKKPELDMTLFNEGSYMKAMEQSAMAEAITKILYPADNSPEGKSLRLRQQYFMCAAAIGDIVNTHMSVYGTLDNLHEKVAIHINDTHPTLAIPELMRILLDDC